MVIEGKKRGVGRPRMTWVKAVESDMRVKGLMREDAEDRIKWRTISKQEVNSYNSRKNSLKTFVVVVVNINNVKSACYYNRIEKN